MNSQKANKWQHNNINVEFDEELGYIHQSPIPSVEQVSSWYQTEFGGAMKGGFIERKKRDTDYWRIAFERRHLNYGRLLGKTEGLRILDVGCGIGDFLGYFKEKGYEVHGIEPNQNFHPLLEKKGITYLAKLTDEMTDDDWQELGQFDIVNMSMLLEHIRLPMDLVQIISEKALKPGGILSIESPNDFNDLQEVAIQANELDRWWIHKLHINYFNFDSLEHITTKAGLNPVHRDCQFPIEMFLLFGDDYVKNKEEGPGMHQKRVRLEQKLYDTGNMDVMMGLFEKFAEAGLGRTAIVYAQK